jgi:hypothetical protein
MSPSLSQHLLLDCLSRHLLLDCLSLWLQKIYEMCRFRIGGGEAIIDFELDVSLDDEEEHDSTDGIESSNAQ